MTIKFIWIVRIIKNVWAKNDKNSKYPIIKPFVVFDDIFSLVYITLNNVFFV